jgi:pimeloyl-ACP methyl ester carboxylesterase
MSKERTTTSGYAAIDGLRMYYESRGEGRPLVLLHGGAGVASMFDEILPVLGKGRRVIGAELQAHGHTADIERPLRYELMADDVAGLIKTLGRPKTDLMGYSLGGGVALRVAIQHPSLVNKLVLVSTTFKRQGWYPEVLAGMQSGADSAEALKQTPMYKAYEQVAPRLSDWPVLMRKLADMLKREYDWSQEVSEVMKDKIPTMIAVGDADSVRTAHAVEFFELLGGGEKDGGWDRSGVSRARLLILPGVTHFEIFRSGALAASAAEFLDSP